jgi:hypothetical protein
MLSIFRLSLFTARFTAMPSSPKAILLTMLLAAFGALSIAGCGSRDAEPKGDRPAADGGGQAAALPSPVGRGAPLPEGFENSGPPATPTRAPVKMSSPDYGMQAFLWWRPEVAERDLGLLADMKFRWVKQIFGWRDIELEKGAFDWERTDRIVEQAETFGLQLMVRVDHQPNWARAGCSMMGPPDDIQDFADFLAAVAERYAGRIDAYQIWNEPNLAREWCDRSPSPDGYAEMLAASYSAIKAVDPRALVISAGLSPTGSQPPAAMPDDSYLERLYEAMGGSSDGHFDLLGVHAAGFAAPPEISPDEAAANKAQYGGERFFTFRRVEDLRAIQERFGDGDKQVAVLEMGWTSDTVHPDYAWHAVSEETKADYLVRAYEYAAENWTPWIGVMSAIFICDQDWTPDNEQYWWCITDPDGSPRPAFAALRDMPKVPQ